MVAATDAWPERTSAWPDQPADAEDTLVPGDEPEPTEPSRPQPRPDDYEPI